MGFSREGDCSLRQQMRERSISSIGLRIEVTESDSRFRTRRSWPLSSTASGLPGKRNHWPSHWPLVAPYLFLLYEQKTVCVWAILAKFKRRNQNDDRAGERTHQVVQPPEALWFHPAL
jgi:hypothetical protein